VIVTGGVLCPRIRPPKDLGVWYRAQDKRLVLGKVRGVFLGLVSTPRLEDGLQTVQTRRTQELGPAAIQKPQLAALVVQDEAFDTMEVVLAREPTAGLERNNSLVPSGIITHHHCAHMLHPQGAHDDVVHDAVNVVPGVLLSPLGELDSHHALWDELKEVRDKELVIL